MKKTLLLLALIAGSLLSANAEDHLTALLKPGDAVLGIQLKNADAYTAFQMDITLPDGMTLSTDADAVSIQRQGEAAPHTVASNVLDNGALRVLAYSYKEAGETKTGNESFTDSKGDLLLLKVNVEGECTVSNLGISNVEFVKTEGLASTELGVTAKGKLGDANNDNRVNLTDAQLILQHFVGNTPSVFVEEAADVDYSATINLTDAQKTVQIFVGNY